MIYNFMHNDKEGVHWNKWVNKNSNLYFNILQIFTTET